MKSDPGGWVPLVERMELMQSWRRPDGNEEGRKGLYGNEGGRQRLTEYS